MADLTNYNGVIFDQDDVGLVYGLSMSAWNKLGIEKAIKSYKIISSEKNKGEELFRENVFKLPDNFVLDIRNPKGMLSNKIISGLLVKGNCSVLLTKNSKNIEKEINKINTKWLVLPHKWAAELENKYLFRKISEGISGIQFADYVIKRPIDLDYKQLYEQFDSFVLQEDVSTSGKGTYFVKNLSDFDLAVEKISSHNVNKVVVSRFIDGKEVSVQVCVGKDKVFCSPIQNLIVNNADLCASEVHGSPKFCGGEWGYLELPESSQNQIYVMADIIGENLRTRGYRGMFGLDFIIDKNSNIFLMELNARLTGLTTPLSMLMNRAGLPSLLLLHVLELGGVPYKLDVEVDSKKAVHGSYLILHNTMDGTIVVKEELSPGVYTFEEETLKFVRDGYEYENLQNENEFILTCVPKSSLKRDPGRKILCILTLDSVMRDENKLSDKYRKIIAHLEKNYFIPTASET